MRPALHLYPDHLLLRSSSQPSVLWHCWLGVRKSIQPIKIKWWRFWCGYLSGVRCRLFAYGPADATALQNPISSLASFKSRLVLPFWYRLTQRPLNGCSSCYDDRQQRSFILSCESGTAMLQTTRKPANNTSWTKLLVTLYFSHVSLQSVYRR